MYAIVKSGSKQYRVAAGEVVEVERLTGAKGDEVTLTDVLMVADGDQVKLGSEAGAKVIATVLGEAKGRKVTNFDYRNKHRRRTVRGHRQTITRIKIKEIQI